VFKIVEVIDTRDELDELAKQPTPTERPSKQPLKGIAVAPEVFQPRGTDERHINTLAQAVKEKGIVSPILVMQIGPKVVVIDGHHRVAAYEKASRGAEVPVEYFDGPVDEAVLEAGRANSQAKLPMANKERQDFAWRLVKTGRYSKAQIADAAAIGSSQVATMRKVRSALGIKADECGSWWKARRMASGSPTLSMTEGEIEEWKEEEAQRWADKLSKALGNKLAGNPEIASRALEIHLGRKFDEVINEAYSRVVPGEASGDVDDDW
jgi:ParB-like chromosome segregation protein Spo0J